MFPSDAAWPSSQAWGALDLVTDGSLLKPIPQAHVCYANGTGDVVNATQCAALTANWTDPYFQYAKTASTRVIIPLDITPLDNR
jgi:hypothetical protein